MKRIATLIVVLAFAGLFTSCGMDKATEPYKDGPKSGERNAEPADLIAFPDGFSNVATKCDHGNRVYVIFKGDDNRGSVAVVGNDPTCPQTDG